MTAEATGGQWYLHFISQSRLSQFKRSHGLTKSRYATLPVTFLQNCTPLLSVYSSFDWTKNILSRSVLIGESKTQKQLNNAAVNNIQRRAWVSFQRLPTDDWTKRRACSCGRLITTVARVTEISNTACKCYRTLLLLLITRNIKTSAAITLRLLFDVRCNRKGHGLVVVNQSGLMTSRNLEPVAHWSHPAQLLHHPQRQHSLGIPPARLQWARWAVTVIFLLMFVERVLRCNYF